MKGFDDHLDNYGNPGLTEDEEFFAENFPEEVPGQEADDRSSNRNGTVSSMNTEHVRYHSSDDMDGLGELAAVTDPVAVVLRNDGSVDVYGWVAVVDQRY